MAQPLRALFFDVDDTVYSTTEFAQNARRSAVRAMIGAGLNVPEDDCLQELNEVISEFSSNYEHHFDKLLLRLPRETYKDAFPHIIVAAGIVAYHKAKFLDFPPYEDAIEVLNVLKERGLYLGIISAGVAIKQAEKIYRLGIHEIVDANRIYITDDLGIAKTNPKIYLRACMDAGCGPAECVYIGDNPDVDVDVPNSIGMKTILSRRSGKYMNVEGKTEPSYVVHNFWDVLDIIDNEFEILPMG